jgi:hypothetical protein
MQVSINKLRCIIAEALEQPARVPEVLYHATSEKMSSQF